jgi:hypothetical protein
VKQLHGGDDGGDDEEGDSDGEHDAVSGRLRQDALESLGHYKRKIAHRLQLPPLPKASEYAAAGARLLKGHKLPVTATALTADDRLVYSVSKGGTILRHDVETGARWVATAAVGSLLEGMGVGDQPVQMHCHPHFLEQGPPTLIVVPPATHTCTCLTPRAHSTNTQNQILASIHQGRRRR